MGDRTNVKERCNKSCSTRPQSFPQLDICSAEKGLRSSPSDKFEKSQSLHSLLSFQNGKFIPVEKNIPGRGLHAENRSQGCIFLSPTKPKIPKVCKFQMEGSILFVSLWFGTSPKDIHKVDENSHFSVEKTVCTTDFFLDDILRMVSSKEELTLTTDTVIYLIQNLGFLINRKTSVLDPCQNIQFLGMEINSVEMTLTLPLEKKREGYSTVSEN